MKRLILLVLLLLLTLAGCTESAAKSGSGASSGITDVAQLHEPGRKIGIPNGAKSDYLVRETFTDADIFAFGSLAEGFMAVKTGKVDAFSFDRNIMQYTVLANPDLKLLDQVLAKDELVIGVRPGDVDLQSKVNSAIDSFAKDGTLEQMTERWLGDDLNPVMPELPSVQNPSGTLVVGTSNENQPMSYLDANGKSMGFDVEYAYRLGAALGVNIELVATGWDALMPMLAANKIDLMIANLNDTGDAMKSMLLTKPYVQTDIVMMVKNYDEGSNAPLLTEFNASDFKGKTIAVWTGSVYDTYADQYIGEVNKLYYNTKYECLEAIKNGKADGTILDELFTRIAARQYPGVTILQPHIKAGDAGFGFSKENPELRMQFNEFLASIKADGTYDDIAGRWLVKEDFAMPDIPLTGENGTITAVTSGTDEPYSFMQDGELVGFDIEIASRFAAHSGYKLELMQTDVGGGIAAVQSGKADLTLGYFITEERKLSMDFSEPYFQDNSVMVVYNKPTTAGTVPTTYNAEDYTGKTIAVWTGTSFDQIGKAHLKDTVDEYYNEAYDCVEALKTGKAFATMNDEPICRKLAAQNPGVTVLYPAIQKDEYGFAFSKENSKLREQFNEFLKEIKADGTYDDMIKRWIDSAQSPAMPDVPLTGENGTISFAILDTIEPFAYVENGKTIGFDLEIAMRFAKYGGYKLEYSSVNAAGRVTAVQSGKVDFSAGLMTITEERKQFVDFSDSYYSGGVTMMVYSKPEANAESLTWWGSLEKSFTQNLLVEGRWKLIVDGLCVSLIITVFAFALATLLGFGVCGLRMSKNAVLRAIGSVYITILRGTPIIVLLMITYYVIFAKVNISSVLVAIIAFGVNGAAFIGEIVRSAILTVDKGQIEAARSMGFSKVGAFFTVTFPQAVRVAFPVYKSEFISLFKMTSVVGYIAIADLTKAGDIIRSRTYDAFFPLIVVALVYLVAASLMIFLFDMINRATDKRRNRA